ncbi:acyl-CoA dehydrogenase [Mucilaginibacter hurinus]|uniref:Acyl-CoA dehydrogenase n=1 Tax=Mucilaginibacter hurinus TaxID=2201324 RepID=A0A367GRE8_9SPHI|nr:acyl-CoA dehydrogenase [Mucilaginibacter hurinus]RCH55665.1 acyl-CoA dehydrogenase [Mucilaginibacter hurinus]
MEHPSIYLEPDWVNTIRTHAPDSERRGILGNEQLALIYEQKWFKFLVPEAYSGLQIPLPRQVRLEEGLAWANGSFGWVVTLCSGAGWFGGFMEAEFASKIFNDAKLCLAGSGAATGAAVITGNGYVINGEWNYASGVHHATHITANCIIKQGDKTVLTNEGSPLILPFIVDRKDVSVIPAWKFVGMMGTGSDAYQIKNLAVDKEHCFNINPKFPVVDAPLYHYPFLQLAEVTLAANLSGMAVHFTDLCSSIFAERIQRSATSMLQKDKLTDILNEVETRIANARTHFYTVVDRSWQVVIDKSTLSEEAAHEVSVASRNLAKVSRESVDTLYPYCGLMAANPETELNQVWRDIHTAGQHSLLTFDA